MLPKFMWFVRTMNGIFHKQCNLGLISWQGVSSNVWNCWIYVRVSNFNLILLGCVEVVPSNVKFLLRLCEWVGLIFLFFWPWCFYWVNMAFVTIVFILNKILMWIFDAHTHIFIPSGMRLLYIHVHTQDTRNMSIVIYTHFGTSIWKTFE